MKFPNEWFKAVTDHLGAARIEFDRKTAKMGRKPDIHEVLKGWS